MLGNIAKKLRLLGYDTEYSSSIEDEKILVLAEKQTRIIISKDYELIQKARKYGLKSIFLSSKDEILQLKEIKKILNLKDLEINSSISRCTKCNGPTEFVEKSQITNQVPNDVFLYNENFWKCVNCGKIYWNGTHIENLQKFVVKINE